MTSSSSSSPEISAATTVDIHDRFSYKHASHDEVLEDLSSRFILNLPDEELASLERICFQVEQAHWFYEDFIREENPKFPSLPLKKFSAMLFHACPLLHQWSHDHEQAFNTFMQYKTRVPVCGAIMLNDTWEKCLLVKGWKASSGWGFPKGKINEDEPEHHCAVREVLEETGYNLAGQINPDDVIEMSIKEQKISLYIVPGVPEDYPFKTRTRKEISKIEWFKLTDLPTWKRSKSPLGKFYLISPFIGALKAFINMRKPRGMVRKTPKSRNGQPGQRQGNSSPSLQPYATDHDHTQESSSQSSSADNGDPKTPSPHYLETVPNNVVDDQNVAEDRVSNAIEMETLDPHFARLLASLSLSASAMHEKDRPNPPSLAITTRESTPPEHSTPIPTSAITASSVSSQPLSEPVFQADWSTTAPRCLMNRLDKPAARSPSPSVRSSTQISSAQSYCQMTPSRSFRPTTPSRLNTAQTRFGAQPNQVGAHATAPPSASPTSSSISPSHSFSSRRSTSTADISPYLSGSVEIPTSGKRLKQLALLESVADESSRMKPNLMRQEGSLPFGTSHSFVREPTKSESRVIYSSESGSSNYPPSIMDNDGFQIRPQTSHAYPGSSRRLTTPPERVSLSQSQIATARALYPNVAGVYPPASHIQGHYRRTIVPGSAGRSPSSSYSSRTVSMFGSVPPSVELLPRDGAHSNNAKLLSILNGNSTADAIRLP